MVRIKTADILTIAIDEKILPYIVQDIAHLIGLPNALKIVDHYKGTSLWVPPVFHPELALVKLIGAEATIKLIKVYGDQKAIEIPKCDDAIRAVRNEKIAASDKSQSQLAREWGLTVRQIRNIQKDVKDDRQSPLF